MILKNCFVFISLIMLVLSSCKHDPVDIYSYSNDTVYFENKILPVLISNCAKSGCHDSYTAAEDVVLDNYSSIMSTGGIIPGKPGKSKLYKKITDSGSEEKMPPADYPQLTNEQIYNIHDWILQGSKNNIAYIPCDTNNVTYAGSIKTITELACTGCHSGGQPAGGYDFTSLAGLQAAAQAGRLIGSISHSDGFKPMPQAGSKLADCQIRMFEIWISQNYPR